MVMGDGGHFWVVAAVLCGGSCWLSLVGPWWSCVNGHGQWWLFLCGGGCWSLLLGSWSLCVNGAVAAVFVCWQSLVIVLGGCSHFWVVVIESQ